MTKEKAIEEIQAIYKLAGLSGCFVYGDIKEFNNPGLTMIEFPDDGSVSEAQIAAFTTACVSPLYRGIMGMLSVAGISLNEMTPKPGLGSLNPMTEYLRASMSKMATGTIKTTYDQLVAPDADIPDEFKECILKLIAPLTKI